MIETYKNRRLVAKTLRDGKTGEVRIEIRCNGQFAWYERNARYSEADALDLAKRYVDEAIERPGAYPVLDLKGSSE